VTGVHRHAERLSRRRALGLAGLVTVPVVTFGLHRIHAADAADGATATPVGTALPG